MYVSTVRLYHPALWKMLYSYRVLLVTLRVLENQFHTWAYFLVRGPAMMAWTRFPLTRDKQPPFWRDVAITVVPIKDRASLQVGAGQLGSNLALASSVSDFKGLQDSVAGSNKGPSRLGTLFGAYMRGYFAALGPAFIKFGQILSMREELPPTVRTELQLLQDQIPPMPWKQVRNILEKELDRPLEEVFEWVEEKPIAAASLAQVHRAKLRKEQEEVALKIQRPCLQGIVVLDTIYLCDIILEIVWKLLPTFRKGFDPAAFTTSYREQLTKEIDFNLEERYQTRYRKLVMAHPIYCQSNYVARTYREYTTTKLLVMEFVHDYYRLDRILDDMTPDQLWAFATTKLEGLPDHLPLHLVWTQIMLQVEGLSRWGLSHGDVHLGNLYAKAPSGPDDHWKIFLCDFGMMIDETEPERIMALECGASLCYYWDGKVIGKAFARQSLVKISQKNQDRLVAHMANCIDKFMIETVDGAEKAWLPRVQRGTQTTVLSEITYGCAVCGLSMAPYNWLLLKNFTYLCNMGMAMWTTFNPTQMWAHHIRKFIKDIVFNDMEPLNITNLQANLDEVLKVVRYRDRMEIKRALTEGRAAQPMQKVWSEDWDVRTLSSPDPYQV